MGHPKLHALGVPHPPGLPELPWSHPPQRWGTLTSPGSPPLPWDPQSLFIYFLTLGCHPPLPRGNWVLGGGRGTSGEPGFVFGGEGGV